MEKCKWTCSPLSVIIIGFDVLCSCLKSQRQILRQMTGQKKMTSDCKCLKFFSSVTPWRTMVSPILLEKKERKKEKCVPPNVNKYFSWD